MKYEDQSKNYESKKVQVQKRNKTVWVKRRQQQMYAQAIVDAAR